jgi:hypothetical protein
MHDNWNKCGINIRIPNIPWLKMSFGAKQLIAHIPDISCLEIADKNPVLNSSLKLVASFVAGSHRAYLMMQVFGGNCVRSCDLT